MNAKNCHIPVAGRWQFFLLVHLLFKKTKVYIKLCRAVAIHHEPPPLINN